MPRANRTGQSGQEQGKGLGRSGRGRMGGQGSGPGGYCVCPSCGKKVEHKAGVPCYEEKCPDCNIDMVRE